MDSSSAAAYVYAKSSGILAKSFVGERAEELFSVKSLRELHGLLFANESPAVPEALLAREIEVSAEKRFIDEYLRLLSVYSNPEKILIAILRFYECNNIKEVGAALSLGRQKMPEVTDIRQYSRMDYSAWPNLQKITKNSPISWYNSINDISEQYKIDSKIDSLYISEIWNAIEELSGQDREEMERLFSTEFSFRNILWALRLKVYYKMSKEEIFERLVFADPVSAKSFAKRDLFAARAIKILDNDIENWEDWKNWKFASMLNPHEDGVLWSVDPTWVEKSFMRELNGMYLKAFHKNPLSVMSLVAWFKIKQFELDCIRTVAEGLRLDVDKSALFEAAGIQRS